MISPTLQKLFARDLNKLHHEISAYTDEALLWKIVPGINNSAGNLALHLIGNLNTYIGADLGSSGYVRDRDAEFSLKDVPRQALLNQIEQTKTTVRTILAQLSETQLAELHSIDTFPERMTNEFFLTHLATHLTYHLGQINYHRRLLDV